MFHYAAILAGRKNPTGPPPFVVIKVTMTADGLTLFHRLGLMNRTSEGCWRFWHELVPECCDANGKLLYLCEVTPAHEPQ